MTQPLKNRTVRGIRDTIPSGYVIGRISTGNGQNELIPISSLGGGGSGYITSVGNTSTVHLTVTSGALTANVPSSTFDTYGAAATAQSNAEAYTDSAVAGLLSHTLASGDIFVGNGSNVASAVAMSGDATIANTGAISVAKTGGVAFGYFATGTDAANLTGTVASAQLPTASTTVLGAVKIDGTSITITGGVISAATGATGANPSATAGDTAVNGSATTFMRSDAAPAVQKGSSSAFGIVKVDGTTITASGGVITAIGSTPSLTHNHIFVGTSGGAAGDVAMSGDATIADTGAITVTKTSGVAFGSFATGTDAANLTGTLASAQLNATTYNNATNLALAGWLNVGSNSNPANTATGELTAKRLTLGVDQVSATTLGINLNLTGNAFSNSTNLGQRVQFEGTSGGTSTNIFALATTAQINGTASAAAIQGQQNLAISNTTGTVAAITGMSLGARLTAAGIVTLASSANFQIVVSAAGNIVTAYGAWARSPSLSGSGTVGTATGLQIDAQKVTGVTKGYGVNQVGTTDLNVLAGRTTVGAAADPGTSLVLDVQSTTGAFAPPRMTTTQRNALTASNGMELYDTTVGAFFDYTAGAWVQRGSGGGGNSGKLWSANNPTSATNTAHAMKGFPFTPYVNMTIYRAFSLINVAASAQYTCHIVTLDASFKILSIVASSATVTPASTGNQGVIFTFASSVALTSGVSYGVLVAYTNGSSGTAIMPIWGGVSTTGLLATDFNTFIFYNAVTPAVNLAVASSGAIPYHILLEWSL